MTYKFHDVGIEIQYHVAGILSGFSFKAVAAGLPVLFETYFGGDWRFFEIWFGLSVLDLVLGVALALKTQSFDRMKLYGWAVKALTHIGTILIFGVLTTLLIGLTGHGVSLIDWFIFVLAVTEAASILSTADQLGLPVHPLARALVEKCRRRAKARLDSVVGDGLARPDLADGDLSCGRRFITECPLSTQGFESPSAKTGEGS